MSLGFVTKCATAFLDFIHVVEAINDFSADNCTMLQTANVVNRLMLLGFSVTETKKLFSNPSNHQVLASLKAKELPSRYLDLLIKLLQGPILAEDDVETPLQFLERAMVAPMADIARVSAEQSFYEIKHCLNNALEQNITPNPNSSLDPILGCTEKLKKLEGQISRALKIKMLAEVSLISSVGDLCKEWYHSIYARAIADLRLSLQQPDPQEIEAAIMNAFPIPAAFHQDLTLRSYICPITLEPIRYPVEDPTANSHQQGQDNPVLYERSAIINSLSVRPLSPWTREPLTVDQLIPRQDIQDVIEMRLEHYSSNVWNYIESSPLFQQHLQATPNNSHIFSKK
ncbi:MAG: hypothetical protein M3A24_03495 [Candidatus Rhabdochlamydia oedothoracis]|nr:hypothetical protein [Candidatus Rhabdochlamydia oedothoracis]